MWRAYQEGKLAECDAFEANDEEFELKMKGHVPLTPSRRTTRSSSSK